MREKISDTSIWQIIEIQGMSESSQISKKKKIAHPNNRKI